MQKVLLLFLSVLMFTISGCASVPRMAETPSGKPEINIQTTDTELVKATITNVFYSRGYILQNDSSYSMFFTKIDNSTNALLFQAFFGNSYSTTPELELRVNIIKNTNNIKVIVFTSMSTQMVGGQVRRQEINNNENFNDIYTALQEVKTTVESQILP